MSRTIIIALAVIAVSISDLAVAAEPAPSPLDPRAAARSPRIETGLEGYRAFTDEPLKDWKDANHEAFEAAVEMGLPGTYANRPPGAGHAGHGVPARAPVSSAPPAAVSSEPSPGSGHQGMKGDHREHTK